jgi:superfamily II DNA or RNA helicase
MVDIITVHNVDQTYVRIECEEGLGAEIGEYFTFRVPGFQFTPSFKAKMWDGKIRLYNRNTKLIYRGLVQEIENFCKGRGYKFVYDNGFAEEFSVKEAVEFIERLDPKFPPRDYQIDAFVRAIRDRRRLLLSPTASGKSMIMYLVMMKILDAGIDSKGLIIVPTINLVEQLYTDFEDYSEKNGWPVKDNVHKIYQGKDKNTEKSVTISTWQSIYKEGPGYFEQFDFVLGDECHHFKSKSLTTIMSQLVNSTQRIGLTGTLDDAKTHKLVLEGLFGPVYKVTTTKELMEAKHLAQFNIKCLVLKHRDEVCKEMAKAKLTYKQELDYLVDNKARNKFIRNLALSLEGNTLVLYQFVKKHGVILYDMIVSEAGDRKVFFVHGGTDVEMREKIRAITEKETNAIIVASFGTFSTGINIKALHNMILASPAKSRIRVLQSIGRTLRLDNTKTVATLFDISDDLRWKKKENFTLKHFMERLKMYGQEKFNMKIYKIDLKG